MAAGPVRSLGYRCWRSMAAGPVRSLGYGRWRSLAVNILRPTSDIRLSISRLTIFYSGPKNGRGPCVAGPWAAGLEPPTTRLLNVTLYIIKAKLPTWKRTQYWQSPPPLGRHQSRPAWTGCLESEQIYRLWSPGWMYSSWRCRVLSERISIFGQEKPVQQTVPGCACMIV